MQIVINIHKKDYDKMCKGELVDTILVAIKNGTPLSEVLNKMRAEIESQREEVSKKHSEDEGLSNYYFGLNDGLKDARDSIDKYKKSEEK